MLNFIYDIPTKVYFGDFNEDELGHEIRSYGNKLMFLYEGNYIKENGLYDLVYKAAEKYAFSVTEFTEIKPNPKLTDIERCVSVCRENRCDVIVAVGGGSTIDTAKAVSWAALTDHDIWSVVKYENDINEVIPVVAISTISATGSEMDTACVISNEKTKEKINFIHPVQRPKTAFLNPVYTFTVSKYQTACGTVDILSHLLETYFLKDESMEMLDRVMEGIMKTVLDNGVLAYNEPTNYDARANLMWAASWALNGFVIADKTNYWTCHPIEHELSAYYDITHGLGLAILLPVYLRTIVDEKSEIKFKNIARNVFGLAVDNEKDSVSEIVIKKFEDYFFEQLNLPSKLSSLNIDSSHFEEMAKNVTGENEIFDYGYRKLSKEQIIQIYTSSL